MTVENTVRPALRRLVCPDCQCESLKIKKLEGWERVIVFLSDRRKYGCKECGLWFRARDRRKFPRAEESSAVSGWAAGLPIQ
jgi:hypothetical protein